MSAHVREPLMPSAKVVVGLLAGSAAVSVLLAIQILANRGLVIGGTFPLIDLGQRLQPALTPPPIGPIASLLALATGIMWLVWQHRGHSNLWARGIPGLRYSPRWAVGWWFVPFASFMPYKTTRELWRNAGRPAPRPRRPNRRGAASCACGGPCSWPRSWWDWARSVRCSPVSCHRSTASRVRLRTRSRR